MRYAIEKKASMNGDSNVISYKSLDIYDQSKRPIENTYY